MKYIVLSIDIVNSRKKAVTNDLLKVNLKNINLKYNNLLYRPFSPSRGDEIQGILTIDKIDYLFKITRKLKQSLYEYKLKIGIGIGSVYDHDSSIKQSWDLNGDAFFKARDNLDYLSKKRNKSVTYTTFISGVKEDDKDIINILWMYMDKIIYGWDNEMFTIAELLDNGSTQENIVKTMYPSKSVKKQDLIRKNISKKIKRHQYYDVCKTEELLIRYIKRGLL